MPLRSDWSEAGCVIARAADVLADPWVLVILRELFSGRSRFDELRDATGAADSVLARRLRTMTDAGLIRHAESGGYALTNAGERTLPILHAYAGFTRAVEPPSDGGLRISCTRCGTEAVSADWCPTCAAPLDAESTTWMRPSMGEPFPVVGGGPR
ncbi:MULTISPECIES: helix-turn-helix domain-containing protein [Microbacterium]|uniref:winged helix-turn-helix transcriptional regulator n=1 Tax=Microbacterium TaxID=33882 RepID=UPI001E288B37|nr:helix-turn-helix domain-containing protein [Microbacterium nymphoidis]MCD2499905.1 helix-turn-helix transcriptional regulator [Microbacterium nymphoidis]